MAPLQTSPRVLIVYYSRTGSTESMASGLARASGADLEALVTISNHRGMLGYLLSRFEGMSGQEARIRQPRYSPKAYDIVLLGTPTWGAALSSPVRTYLNRYAAVLPEVGFFVTYGARGAERVMEEMQSISSKRPLATLALRKCDLKCRPSVYFGEFWERVLCAWEARTPTSFRDHEPTSLCNQRHGAPS